MYNGVSHFYVIINRRLDWRRSIFSFTLAFASSMLYIFFSITSNTFLSSAMSCLLSSLKSLISCLLSSLVPLNSNSIVPFIVLSNSFIQVKVSSKIFSTGSTFASTDFNTRVGIDQRSSIPVACSTV